MMRAAKFMITCTIALASAASLATAQSTSLPRYAKAIEQELQSMALQPSCQNEPKGRYHCTYEARPVIHGQKPIVHAVYSDQTDTVYFYIERYLSLPPDSPKTPVVLQRLMELNWELLVGKLEWNPRTGEVRLSAVLNTDSNFDRRAFRSVVHALDVIAARYDRELRALAANP